MNVFNNKLMVLMQIYLFVIIISFNIDFPSVSGADCQRFTSKTECKNIYNIQQLNAEYQSFWRILHIKNTDLRLPFVLDQNARQFTTIQQLYLNNVGEINISEYGFHDFIGLEVLDVSNSKLLELNRRWFSSNNIISKLVAANNTITTLLRKDFKTLLKLNELQVQQNEIEFIENDAFIDLVGLFKLNLANNRLKNIKFVADLSNLFELNVNHNEITSIESDTLKALINLETLLLEFNAIQRIETRYFSGWDDTELKLKHLALGHNQITDVQLFAFSGLKDLQILTLNNNLIEKLLPETFSGLESLITLNLNGNNLAKMSDQIFGNVPLANLKHFSVVNNDLNQVGLDIFEKEPNLESLEINFNKITHLCSIKFPQNLFQLYGNNNLIRKLSNNCFVQAPRLAFIHLHNNLINTIQPLAFRGLQFLETIQLENNRIKEVHVETFWYLNNLETLDISNNNIDELLPNSFQGLTRLLSLDLCGNNLITINGNMFGNRTLYSLRNIFLNNNNIANIDPNTFQLTPTLNTLTLASNKLTYLPDGIFHRIPQITALDIGNNLLTNISPILFLRTVALSTLKIHNNRLTFLPDYQQYFAYIDDIRLEGNPWKCVCFDEILSYLTAKQIPFKNYITSFYKGKSPICVDTKEIHCTDIATIDHDLIMKFNNLILK